MTVSSGEVAERAAPVGSSGTQRSAIVCVSVELEHSSSFDVAGKVVRVKPSGGRPGLVARLTRSSSSPPERGRKPPVKPWNQIAFQPAIGLMIDEQQIAMSVTVAGLRGRHEVAREIRQCENQAAEEVLKQMLAPWVDPAGAPRAGEDPGVPASVCRGARVFQAAVPITPANRQHTPQNFFLEAVQVTNVRAEDRIVELIKVDLGHQQLACVAASPRGIVESSIEMMSKLGTRVGLIESAPAALWRAGAYHRRAPRGSKLCARFFLAQSQAIGLLAAGDQVLFWHTFELPSGGEIGAALAAYSTLWMMGRHARITLPIDTVVIHGRLDLVLTDQQQEAFGTRTGARVLRSEQPAYDLSATALGLALANPLADNSGLNLARTLKPPVTIRDIFPYGELVAHAALMLAVSLLLVGMATESNHRLSAVRGELKSFPWLKNQDQAKLDTEKKTVQDKMKAVSAFRDTRVKWSGALRKIAAGMPESTLITATARRLRDRGRSSRHVVSAGSLEEARRQLPRGTPLAGNDVRYPRRSTDS